VVEVNGSAVWVDISRDRVLVVVARVVVSFAGVHRRGV
jgi:hypothetical protein